jgi:hypothetical protein
MYKIGDHVRVLPQDGLDPLVKDGGELGIVVGLRNATTYDVELEDGFVLCCNQEDLEGCP